MRKYKIYTDDFAMYIYIYIYRATWKVVPLFLNDFQRIFAKCPTNEVNVIMSLKRIVNGRLMDMLLELSSMR